MKEPGSRAILLTWMPAVPPFPMESVALLMTVVRPVEVFSPVRVRVPELTKTVPRPLRTLGTVVASVLAKTRLPALDTPRPPRVPVVPPSPIWRVPPAEISVAPKAFARVRTSVLVPCCFKVDVDPEMVPVMVSRSVPPKLPSAASRMDPE